MEPLSELLNLLTETDKKRFIQFLQRRNKREDVKNLALLNLIETDDIPGLKGLYDPDKNLDAYHALRKRFQDNLLLFLSQRIFESNHSDAHQALRLLVVGRFLLENHIVKIAFKCLGRAERLAEELEQFNLLNEILLLKLQYAHLPEGENFETLSERFTSNQADMLREARLNVAYAFLRQELQHIQLKGKIVNLTALIITTIRKYRIALRELLTYKSIYQILFIANEYAAIQQNYTLIERLINRTNKFLEDRPDRKPYSLFHHISILYFLANFHLRQKNFATCDAYLDRMLALMRSDSRYDTLFQLRYKLLAALSLFYTGAAARAVSLLQDALATRKIKSRPEDVEDLRVCLTMFLALRNDRASLKQLSLLTRTDAWYEKEMGMLWTIRKNLMEILVHAQFSNIDLTMSRLHSFRRRYKKYLLKTSEERVLIFVSLVEKYLKRPDVVFDNTYKEAVLRQLDSPDNRDIFTLSFIAWTIAKWQKKTAYEVVLSLLSDADKHD
ncbi:hypothetical protein [Pedobacter sp. SYP-B3415]|uniref:hypothetical protein n=1 Tax=Pedobacter sp. SYP-B3415 TaxID=2496641 RepID=UPI00101CCD21|nr:hypothetical protein [Pedobacter sp. SYP-B3415]